MSRTEIENLLHDIQMACIRHREPDAERYVYATIAWYIETGRASLDWIRQLKAKKHYKGLITKALKGDKSDVGIIAVVTREIA
jgi:hypothetical protein